MTDEPLPATGVLDERAPLLRVVPEEAEDASLDLDQLGSRIVGLAGRLASATARWLLLVGRFDAQAAHERFGLAVDGALVEPLLRDFRADRLRSCPGGPRVDRPRGAADGDGGRPVVVLAGANDQPRRRSRG